MKIENINNWLKLRYICEQVFGKDIVILRKGTPMNEDMVNYPEVVMDYDWYIEIRYSEWGYIDSDRMNMLISALRDNGFDIVKWELAGGCGEKDEVFYLDIYVKEHAG